MKIIDELVVRDNCRLITLDEDIPLSVGRTVYINGKNYSFNLPFDLKMALLIVSKDSLIGEKVTFCDSEKDKED